MVDLIYCEILKLKRSKMFIISFLGAAAAPLMCLIGCIKNKMLYPEKIITFKNIFFESQMYFLLLVGVVLFGVITAYLFCREYSENTLKSILTVPVSKIKFLIGKYIILFLWTLSLTLFAWLLNLIFGLFLSLDGLSLKVIFDSLLESVKGSCMLFLATTPFVFVTLWLKNLVPSFIMSGIITMINIAVFNDSDVVAIYPWSAVYVIATGAVTKYPLIVSVLSILIVSAAGFAAGLIYFKKSDIR